MKPISDLTCLVADYGTFTCVAEKLAETYKRVLLHTPCDQEFSDMATCMEGYGVKNVERCDQPLDPEVIRDVDMLVVPDRGFAGIQKHFREMGKAVWGSFDTHEIEDYRTLFLDTVKEVGLPYVPYQEINGLTELSDHLHTVKDKWVKLNRFRGDMETWHHIDYEHSRPELQRLADRFGGAQELVVFIVQDSIATEIEIGYDGACVDGEYPVRSFSGYEKKNDLYLGVASDYIALPPQVREVNEKLAPIFKQAGYRNFMATEIRVAKDGTGYYTDATNRMPGQTGEHLVETMTNFAEFIAEGSQGNLIVPKFSHKFATEATLHYTGDDSHEMLMKLPAEKARKFIKLYHYYIVDGFAYFPTRRNDELGVVIGQGNTIEGAIDNLKKNFEALAGEPVAIHTHGFADLLDNIKTAQASGVKFTEQNIPAKEIAIK